MNLRTSRFSAAVAAALSLLLVPLFAAGPASADDFSTGQWYLDALHIGEAHSAGITGDGVTIAIMDSPVNNQVPALTGANLEPQKSSCFDDSGAPLPVTSTDLSGTSEAIHGTDVASVLVGTGAGYDGELGIQGIAPGARVLYYAVAYDGADGLIVCPQTHPGIADMEDALAADMNDAIDQGADIISISLGVNTSPKLVDALARAHREGVVVLAALPNANLSEGADWPGSANGVVAVQAVDSAGRSPVNPDGGLNTSFSYTTVAAPGVGILAQGTLDGAWTDQRLETGTSLATPITAGLLALVLQKYPDATGNQLIQTLIHNTGRDDHDLQRNDELGYGIASATHMLKVDPTQYPDVNPLLTDDGNFPTMAESTTGPTSTPSDGGAGGGNSAGFPWVIVIVGLLVLIGIIVLVVVLATRRARIRVK